MASDRIASDSFTHQPYMVKRFTPALANVFPTSSFRVAPPNSYRVSQQSSKRLDPKLDGHIRHRASPSCGAPFPGLEPTPVHVHSAERNER